MTRSLIAVACVAVLVGVSGCDKESESPSAPTPVTVSVKYKVESPYSASVTYSIGSGATSQQSGALSPWERTFSAKAGDWVYLSAQNDSASGCVFVTIYVNNTIFKVGSSCGAYVIATVSGTI